MAGTNLYWGHGERALLALAEELRIPVFLNGLARGCVPADHELFFSRARGTALKGADVALVVGVPMDFRLGFGGRSARRRRSSCSTAPSLRASTRVRSRPSSTAALAATLDALREAARAAPATSGLGRAAARASRTRSARPRQAELNDDRAPLHPMRLYRELGEVLDRDAIVIGDGGDFVSYAGRVVDSYEPGCWLDPGPFGCLGSGPGYALAAKLARPERQVVLLLGDGAFGFSGHGVRHARAPRRRTSSA